MGNVNAESLILNIRGSIYVEQYEILDNKISIYIALFYLITYCRE